MIIKFNGRFCLLLFSGNTSKIAFSIISTIIFLTAINSSILFYPYSQFGVAATHPRTFRNIKEGAFKFHKIAFPTHFLLVLKH